MELRYAKEATVGTLVLVAVALFVGGTMWLGGRSFGRGRSAVRVQFPDVSGLKAGSFLRISGAVVGKVERVEFVDVGKVLVDVTLPETVTPRIDASARISALNLVGDFVVDFDPGRSATPLPPGTVILGAMERGLSSRAAGLAERADTLLLNATALLGPDRAARLDATLDELQRTLRQSQRAMALYSDTARGPVRELTRTMASFRAVGARLDTLLSTPAVAQAAARSDSIASGLVALTRELSRMGAQLDTLLAGMNRGEGTLGLVARDSALYWNAVRATASLDSLLTELSRNPGKLGITVKMF